MIKRTASQIFFFFFCVLLSSASCDLFSAAGSEIVVKQAARANSDGEQALDPAEPVTGSEAGGKLTFSYDPSSPDAVALVRSIAGINAPGIDAASVINIMRLYLVNAENPDEIEDFDEEKASVDDGNIAAGDALSVSCRVQEGGSYHILLLFGHDNADNTPPVLLKTGYARFRANGVGSVTVPLNKIVVDVQFVDKDGGTANDGAGTGETREAGRIAKTVGLDATIDTLRVHIGTTSLGKMHRDDPLRVAGGDGLYALAEAAWAIGAGGGSQYGGGGTVTFPKAALVVNSTPPVDSARGSRISVVSNGVSYVDIPIDSTVITATSPATTSLNFELPYTPFGFTTQANPDAVVAQAVLYQDRLHGGIPRDN